VGYYAKTVKKKGSLDTERATRLDELGIVWDVLADQWENNYKLLCTFFEREGICNVPMGHVEDGVQLGNWISAQRQLEKNGRLDIERVTRLDELGMFCNQQNHILNK